MDMDSDKPLLPRPTQSPQAQPRRGTQVHQPSSRLSNVTDVTELPLPRSRLKNAMRGSALVYGLDQLVLAFRIFGLAFWAFWLTFKELILL